MPAMSSNETSALVSDTVNELYDKVIGNNMTMIIGVGAGVVGLMTLCCVVCCVVIYKSRTPPTYSRL